MERAVKKWQQAFVQKYGEDLVEHVRYEDLQGDELYVRLHTPSMFGEKSLLVIRMESEEDVKNHGETLAAAIEASIETLVVFVVLPFLPKQTKGWKALQKVGEIEQFKKGEEGIDQYMKAFQGVLDAASYRYLQQKIKRATAPTHQLEQLYMLAQSKTIAKGDIDALFPELELGEAFGLIDALMSKQPRTYISILRLLEAQGEDPHKLLGLLVWQMEQLAYVAHAKEVGMSDQALMSATGMKPFPLKKAKAALRSYGKADVLRMIATLSRIDIGSKTGGIPAHPKGKHIYEHLLELAL